MNPKSIPDGGPAFPPMHDPDTHASGMTLRDYFAAKALQGICAAPEHLDRIGSFKNAAATAYELADAMLAAATNPAHTPVGRECHPIRAKADASEVRPSLRDAQQVAESEDDAEMLEIGRVIRRLASSDQDFQDCEDAAALLRKYQKLRQQSLAPHGQAPKGDIDE